MFGHCSRPTSSSAAEASAVTETGAITAATGRVSQAAGRTSTSVPETTHQPVSTSRRHGLLRVQGRRISSTGDSLDETRTSTCRQGQVGGIHGQILRLVDHTETERKLEKMNCERSLLGKKNLKKCDIP